MTGPAPRRRGLRSAAMLLSPFPLIAIGRGTERLCGAALGAWAWVPAMFVFWGAIAALVAWTRGFAAIRGWIAPPHGARAWSVLAVLVGLGSVREFLAGWRTLGSPAVLIAWLVFGLLNPWFEEGYWRGLLIDAAESWKGLAVLYSAALFALSHPLVWGVHSVALRHPAAPVGLGLVGLVWGLTYWRTSSLRWTIAGHCCANLLGLSVPVLLNLHVPAGLR